MFHLLKASLGTGILAMPNAFHNAGWLVGFIGTLVIGLLCTYNIHILVSTLRYSGRQLKIRTSVIHDTPLKRVDRNTLVTLL